MDDDIEIGIWVKFIQMFTAKYGQVISIDGQNLKVRLVDGFYPRRIQWTGGEANVSRKYCKLICRPVLIGDGLNND